MASFTKWDTLLSVTLQACPLGVPLSKVLLHCNERLVLLKKKEEKTRDVCKTLTSRPF